MLRSAYGPREMPFIGRKARRKVSDRLNTILRISRGI